MTTDSTPTLTLSQALRRIAVLEAQLRELESTWAADDGAPNIVSELIDATLATARVEVLRQDPTTPPDELEAALREEAEAEAAYELAEQDLYEDDEDDEDDEA